MALEFIVLLDSVGGYCSSMSDKDLIDKVILLVVDSISFKRTVNRYKVCI